MVSDCVFVPINLTSITQSKANFTFNGIVEETQKGTKQNVVVLIDSGASATMICHKLARKLGTKATEKPTTFKFANGTLYQSKEACKVDLQIQDYTTTLTMLACQLDGVDVILGRDWLKAEQPTIDWTTGTVVLTRDTPPNAATTTATTNKAEATAKPTVEVMSTASMRRLLKKPHQLEHVSLVVPKNVADNSTKASAPATAPEEIADILQQHQQLFVEPTSLPPKRPLFDHRITLIPDSQPAYRNYVRLSHAEAEELAVQLGTLLEKDFIKASSSPYGAPVLFVKKKDGSLRMCLDYRGLNHITTRDKYPLPNISDILDRVATAKVFSKMDLRAGYHQVRMADEDTHKTAFVTHMGSFEWRVLPMGLTNAPATFQRLMNSVLQEHHAYAVVYLDDILVFSQDIQAHKEHLKAVLASLEKAQLRLHKTKCEFGKQHVTFLGHTVGEGMLGMEKGKVEAV